MVDTPAVLGVRDGAAAARNLGGATDPSNTFYPEHSLRADGASIGAANPFPMRQTGGITITQTIVSLTANQAGALVAANQARRYLALQTLSGGDVTLGFPTALAGQGWRLSAGGDPLKWDNPSLVPLQAIGGISTTASIVIVLEGM